MDIGCILTGQQSRVVGIFKDLRKAQKYRGALEEKYGVPSLGKHVFRILPMPEPESINEHYET